jgi:5-methylcytosine-specific restriction endonuclease McrA
MDNEIKLKIPKSTTNCGKTNGTKKTQKVVTKKTTSFSKKNNIPKKIREEVWKHYNGNSFESSCKVSWCTNIIDVFNYHVGHDIPESKGGKLEILNLKPICSSCNLSMGDRFSITDWDNIGINERSTVRRLKLYLKSSMVLLVVISIACIGLYNEKYLKSKFM